jgi:hypothetical protein
MIEAEERYVNSVMVKRYLEDNFNIDVKSMTGEDVIEKLFGGYNNGYTSDMRIVNDYWEADTKWWHRLNRFWAYPLTVLCSPYQYITKGQTGWSDKTKFGHWMLRACGYR